MGYPLVDAKPRKPRLKNWVGKPLSPLEEAPTNTEEVTKCANIERLRTECNFEVGFQGLEKVQHNTFTPAKYADPRMHDQNLHLPDIPLSPII